MPFLAQPGKIAHMRNLGISGRVLSPTGLRERKKEATRDALSRAALDLAIDRGVDAITAELIAEAANVSTRTFHNYFSSKEDAILFVVNKSVEHVIDSFAARSPAEPVLDSLEAVLIDLVETSEALDHIVALTRLMAEHPTLIARQAGVHDTTSAAILAEIGRRTGTDPDVDLYPRLVYHAANAVSRAVIELHITNATKAAMSRRVLAETIREGFAHVRLGLPQPGPDPADAGALTSTTHAPRTE
jgi:AcrR family transcriptional regulator